MSIEWQRPITDAQLGIWLGQQVDTRSPRYNAAEYISLRGPLDKGIFEKALGEIIDQSPTLHLVFKQTEAGPLQYFKKAEWTLEQLDFSEAGNNKARLGAAKKWMQEDLAKTVDLEHGPVFKQALLKLEKNHVLWYQRIHHIACDGFAFALLTEMVAERYSSLANNPIAADEKDGEINLSAQITRFEAVGEEAIHYRQSKSFLGDREFWLKQLNADENKSLGKVQSLSRSTAPIADTSIRISDSIAAEEFIHLQQTATHLNLNWSEILLAAVAQTLYYQTTASEITLGVPVMNRIGSASLRIPAMVMNIIPLRVEVENRDTFAGLAKRISQNLKNARPHLRYRYEHLKQDLGITGTQKLFGPVVNIMPFDRPLNFAGLKAQAHNLSAGPVEDISFAFVLEKGDDSPTQGSGKNYLRFDLEANPNRYSKEDLTKIQRLFIWQLRKILKDVNAPLEIDREQLSWLEGKALAQPSHSVLNDIYQRIVHYPDDVALQRDSQLFSYQELAKQSAAMAFAMEASGAMPGSIIALVLPRSEQAIISALACWLLDCTFVFLDPEAPRERNELIIGDANPTLIVAEKINRGGSLFMANSQVNLVTIQYLQQKSPRLPSDKLDALWKQAGERKLIEINTPAYLIYTSGSTGTPKGVVIGHRALAEFVASNKDSYNIQKQDRVLQFAPLHFDACIEEIFVTLSQGARLVLRNNSMLESMPAFLQQCVEWEISLLDLPTAFWHELAFACEHLNLQLPPSLRAIIIGGEAVIAERVAHWRARFGNGIALFNTYGPSEATVIATCINLCSNEQMHQPISIGSPLAGRAVAVVDENLRILPKGEEGELLLCGSASPEGNLLEGNLLNGGLADGYLHLPEKTARAFVSLDLPWFEQPRRAYRTGDRVKINNANHIEFIGRLDDQIKISGYRIDPLEVEAALIKLEGVREAAVVSITGLRNDKTLVAHLVMHEQTPELAIQQVRAELRALLPAPMLPSDVIYHDKLPKNSSGKIDRKALQQESFAIKENQTESDLQPHNQLNARQQIILSVWQEVLGQKNIQLDDDFFALGGQSLQCIQVANRLSAKLQREIPVAWLFQHPSIAALDKLLNQNTRHENLAPDSHQLMADDCDRFAKELPPAREIYHRQSDEPKRILLTGATGFVGAQLLAKLVEQGHKIICLVRGQDTTSAYEKIYQAFANQSLINKSLTAESATLPDNIQIQLADIELPRFGLPEDIYSQLAESIDLIIHNAANTSVMRDYSSLRAANALSTAELLTLAAIGKVPFHLISTVAVAAYDAQENCLRLPEDFVPQHSYLRDGYQQSKWVAENLANIAHQKGYPINVYRLARVTGDLDSAYVNQKDLVWNILQAGLSIGVLPDLHFSEPWTPVDKIAEFISRHSVANPGAGVFNLAPQKNVALTRLYEWLIDLGQSFSVIPLPQWCEKVKQLGNAQHQPIAEFFIRNMEQASKQPEDTGLPLTPRITREKFANAAAELQLQLQLPVIDQQLFNRYFAYASARGWFAALIKQEAAKPEEFSYE